MGNKMSTARTEEERVYRILKGDIVSGKLLPGERIVIAKISQILGVSAMPIRAALKELQKDGLIEIVPYAGATVKKLDGREYSEISAIRMLLEPYAAELAAVHMTDDEIDEMGRIVEKMEEYAAQRDNAAYSDMNTQFHAYLNSHCGNKTLSDLIEQLTNQSKITRQFYVLRSDRIDESLAEHRKIVELLRERKSKEVAEFVRQNKHGGYTSMMREILKHR